MDIELYDIMLKGLKEFNDSLTDNYGNVVLPYPSEKPTYPYTVFDEIRNTANKGYNSRICRLSSVGYRLDIYAKDMGKFNKQTIAREVAKKLNDFLTYNCGLTQVSWNRVELENDGSIYCITMTYSASLYENRRILY